MLLAVLYPIIDVRVHSHHTLEQDISHAEQALSVQDSTHAAVHIAAIFSKNAKHPALENLLETWVTCTPNPSDSVPLSQPASVGEVLMLAHVLHRVDKSAEAVLVAYKTLGIIPEQVDWLLSLLMHWLSDSKTKDSLNLDEFAVATLHRIQDQPGLSSKLLPLVSQVGEQREPHPLLAFVHSKLLREKGKIDEAIAAAQRSLAQEESYWPLVALAGAFRIAQQYENALQAYERAIRVIPHPQLEPSILRDAADLYLESNNFTKANELYARSLLLEPENLWARASVLYLQAIENDKTARESLEMLTNNPDAIPRARILLKKLDPIALVLEPPDSACLNMVNHFLNSGQVLSGATIALSSIEPPSALMAAQTIMLSSGLSDELDVAFDNFHDPDARLPIAEAEKYLWIYSAAPQGSSSNEGDLTMLASPCFGPPATRVANLVGQLATEALSTTWILQAKELAQQLTPNDGDDLLSCMLHPPANTLGFRFDEWLFRTQVAAAMLVCFLDEGWESSVRRKYLQSILYGPADWTTKAGIIATTELLRLEPNLVSQVINELFTPLMEVREGAIYHCCIFEPLVRSLLRVEVIPQDVRSIYEKLLPYVVD